jgi:hypothetical protein
MRDLASTSDAVPSQDPTASAFRRVRRLAETGDEPHRPEDRPSSPPAVCGWRALELCQGARPLSVTWLPPSPD